jgi:uncharacterized protein YcbX
MSAITVSQLVIYPVKSLGGIAVERLELTESGPAFDRQWMIVNPHGRFLTQRVLPQMCLISTELRAGSLWLKAAGRKQLSPEIEVPRGGGEPREVTVWRDTVLAHDCGNEVAHWLSAHLETDCRLVYLPAENTRTAPAGSADFADQLAFADAYPLLLTNQQSLDEFNQHLGTPIGMERFRPNVVVSGAPAYAEDSWQRLRIAKQEFELVSPCTRCVMPSINPATAEKQQTVIDTLNQTRRFGTETRFGQNIIYQLPGYLTRGATVEVIESSP